MLSYTISYSRFVINITGPVGKWCNMLVQFQENGGLSGACLRVMTDKECTESFQNEDYRHFKVLSFNL